MTIKVNSALTEAIIDVLEDRSIKVVCTYADAYDTLSFVNEYPETCAENIIIDMFGDSSVLNNV